MNIVKCQCSSPLKRSCFSLFIQCFFFFFLSIWFQPSSNWLFRSVLVAFKADLEVRQSQNTQNLQVLISSWQQEVSQALPRLAVTDFCSGRRRRGRLNVQSVLICSRRAAVWPPPPLPHPRISMWVGRRCIYAVDNNQLGFPRTANTANTGNTKRMTQTELISPQSFSCSLFMLFFLKAFISFFGG